MEEALKNLQKKRIVMLGLGIENFALIKYLLAKSVEVEISVFDSRDKNELGQRFFSLRNNKNINWLTGQNIGTSFGRHDIIFRSPGFPLFQEALQQEKERGTIISSPMKLFFSLCPQEKIIGVTGSKGKGTTASLIQAILTANKLKVLLGGNIGIAPFSFLNQVPENDWVVLELSSFQLEDMETSPHIGVITNLTEEHLKPADPLNPNFHENFSEYAKAKLRIIRYQQKGDWAVLNESLKNNSEFFVRGKHSFLGHGKKIYFNTSNLSSHLVGKYNQENIAAGTEVARILGIKPKIVREAVKNFRGLPHRIEFVKEYGGVKYYDNSFATTPEATMADLDSFVAPIILFLGGADKGSSFRRLAKKISQQNVKFIVLFEGEATAKISQELLSAGFPRHKMKLVKSMAEGMILANKQARAGDVVLLSSACASFGMFKNYKERGELFQKEVMQL